MGWGKMNTTSLIKEHEKIKFLIRIHKKMNLLVIWMQFLLCAIVLFFLNKWLFGGESESDWIIVFLSFAFLSTLSGVMILSNTLILRMVNKTLRESFDEKIM